MHVEGEVQFPGTYPITRDAVLPILTGQDKEMFKWAAENNILEPALHAKAAQVLPFWQDWLKHHERLRARGVPHDELDAFRWTIEELRVSLFAPEVKAAVPVSSQRLAEQWKRLNG